MKKTVFLLFYLFLINISFAQSTLKVSPNGHYLQFENGKPFFWLGDTGWHLFTNLLKEDIIKYLNNRKEKGFNVIQIVASTRRNNRYNEPSFLNNNPSTPNTKYFDLVDWTIAEAAKRNIYIALLPAWGQSGALEKNNKPLFNKKNAYDYGSFLGKRYKNARNIVWVLGGDKPAYTETADWRPIYRSMLHGIQNAGAHQLVTYHPAGESSSTQFWNCEKILDFNMLQSGHRVHDLPVWEWIKRDRAYKPYKPVLDSEPNYEGHPVNWNPANGYFTAYDVRKQLYRSVFSGAAGVTYGHHSIWQFYYKKENNIAHAIKFWDAAMDDTAAFQAGYLRRLIESRPLLNHVPAWEMVAESPTDAAKYITPFYNEDKSYAMIYIPFGQTVKINLKYINAKQIVAWWFNPRNSEAIKIGAFEKKEQMDFTTPSSGVNNDWVLVIDDASKNYKIPARTK